MRPTFHTHRLAGLAAKLALACGALLLIGAGSASAAPRVRQLSTQAPAALPPPLSEDPQEASPQTRHEARVACP